MQELERLGRYLVKNRRCVLTYARQTSDATLQVHVDSDWAGDFARKKEHDRGDCPERQTFVETHVMFADACCTIMRRSRVRFDSKSGHELGKSITLPRLEDSSAARCVARRCGSGGTSGTLADTTLMAAESSSSWSLDIGCRCRRAESSRYTYETMARSQDSRVVRTCWSKMVALKHLQG